MKKFRGYIFSRQFHGERVPQKVQNLVIREYCKLIGALYLLSATEYAMENSQLILNQVLEEITNIDGVIMYSIFQLPIQKLDRLKIYERVIRSKKELCFALEDIQASNTEDFIRIENIILIKMSLNQCYLGS
jgi:sporadic carbohydrate cluster protein (TIGR04323 family)